MTIAITNGQLFVRLIILVVGFVIAISAIYLWLIPEYFQGYSSYSILIIGVSVAGVFGGYTSIKSCPSSPKISHKIFSVLSGLFVAALVAVLSLLIMVYVMGI